MKKIVLFLFPLLSVSSLIAQGKKQTYMQFDIATPLKGNPDRTDGNEISGNTNYWFLPDGLSAKLGYGIHYNKTISAGFHSGIDWKGNAKLVVVPVFTNIKVSPKIAEETRMYLQAGYGKSFAIGRGNLSGDYKKVSLGIENSDGLSLFIELAQYGFYLNHNSKISSLSLGISAIRF